MSIEHGKVPPSQHSRGDEGEIHQEAVGDDGLDDETLRMLREDAARMGRTEEEVLAEYKQLESDWDEIVNDGPRDDVSPEIMEKRRRSIRELINKYRIQRRG